MKITMDNNEPTNKDLHHLISDIQEKVTGVRVEFGKLNGSVKDISKWKERITGAGWAVGITMTVLVIPLFTWAFITISNIPENIDKSVEQAFDSRVNKVTDEEI